MEAADEVCRAAGKCGVRSNIYQANVSCEDEAKAMIEAVTKDFGGIDILVNNAGITRDKSFLKMTKIMWDEVMGVNLNGVFHVTRLVLPAMVEAGWGRIINMTSIVGQTGNFGQANYAVSKGGLIAFTMTLAREVAQGRDRQCGCPRIHRNGHDQGSERSGAAGGNLDDPRGPAGTARRSGGGSLLPRLAPPAISPARSFPSTAACTCNCKPRPMPLETNGAGWKASCFSRRHARIFTFFHNLFSGV